MTGTITFAGASAELVIGTGDVPKNTIAGLAVGDSIDLAGVTGHSVSVNGADNQLLVKNRGGTTSRRCNSTPLRAICISS